MLHKWGKNTTSCENASLGPVVNVHSRTQASKVSLAPIYTPHLPPPPPPKKKTKKKQKNNKNKQSTFEYKQQLNF